MHSVALFTSWCFLQLLVAAWNTLHGITLSNVSANSATLLPGVNLFYCDQTASPGPEYIARQMQHL